MKKTITIITPCYNEEENIQDCYNVIKILFQNQLTQYNYEHIICDNASTDNTLSILKKLVLTDPHLKVIVNSRNFGVFNSMFNGLLNAKGDAVIPFVPADMQDPPNLIPDFLQKWEDGFEIVYGQRKDRDETFLLKKARSLYYKIVESLAHISIPLNVGEFTLIDRKVVDALKQCKDYYPYLRGLIANCGFKTTVISYRWRARKKGISKANFYALIDQGLNGLISFTNIPLRIVMFTGFIIAILSIIYAIVTFMIGLIWFRTFAQPGILTLIVAIFFFSGVILFSLGMLGEYISAIHFQVRSRPLVIEREKINF